MKFIPEMRFISESLQERIPCYRVLDDNGQPILGDNFVQVFTYLAFCFIVFACIRENLEVKLTDVSNIRSVRKLLLKCIMTWLHSKLWTLSFMRHKGKVEYHFM